MIPDDLLRELVFFNIFEELNLPIKGPIMMEDSTPYLRAKLRV